MSEPQVTILGHCTVPDMAKRPALKYPYAYVPAGTQGVQVIDVSTPVRPRLVDGAAWLPPGHPKCAQCEAVDWYQTWLMVAVGSQIYRLNCLPRGRLLWDRQSVIDLDQYVFGMTVEKVTGVMWVGTGYGVTVMSVRW